MLRELEAAPEAGALEGLDNAIGLNCCAAQAAALLGQRKLGGRALRRAEAALARASSAPRGHFDHLRLQELGREVEALRGCLAEEEAFDLAGGLRRLFAFPAHRGSGAHEGPAGEVLPGFSEVFTALCRGFGVEECLRRGLASREDLERHFQRCFREDGVLRWPRLFGRRGLPTKLELCSGSGDWVIAQARAEAATANWVASELRYDRAHSIFAKMVLARVQNLSVFAGDAGSLLRARVPPASLSVVCVNFPEPPQTVRHASCDEAESQLHLLTPAFFRDVHAALVAAGVLTVFSDNEEYMRSVGRTLGDLYMEGQRIFTPLADVPVEHVEGAEQENGILVFQGSPGAEAGHGVAAASQFDRFFAHGQHSRRYYIAVAKS